MNFTALVDVAIGLTVVYLGASLFVTIFNEYLAQVLNSRGKQLCDSLALLIDDTGIKNGLKQYPLLQPFFNGTRATAPTYLDPIVFARLLLGSFPLDAKIQDVRQRWLDAIQARMTTESQLKSQLLAAVNTGAERAEDLVGAVSEWTDRSLTMLGEGYKRRRQWTSFAIGLTLAGLGNLDTIALASRLYTDKETREAVVAVGVQLTEAIDRQQFEACMKLGQAQRKAEPECQPLLGLADAVTSRNETLGVLPLGWSAQNLPTAGSGWALKALGCLLTAFALSLGAPFWFDFLSRFISVRHGMRKPDPAPTK
ncbi:MAG: hypothetical protein RL033_3546 [Pseudomonadota bacterium]|jgi:hypothetical protein